MTEDLTSKDHLRLMLQARRAEIAEVVDHACVIPYLLEWLDRRPEKPRVTSLYAAIHDEFDPAPLAQALWERGLTLALPIVDASGKMLQFRHWTPSAVLTAANRYRIPEPPRDADHLTPDLVIVPMLGFDPEGYRVGYGVGFYDRTLRALRRENPELIAIGLAFDEQEVDRIPSEDHDEKIDAVLTPSGLRWFNEA